MYREIQKGTDQFEHGYALLIGIRYGFTSRPLEGTLKDTEALYQQFTRPDKAAYKPENIFYLKENDATYERIIEALDELAKKAASDPQASVIVYFSGHGGTKDNRYFLVPYDYNKGHLLHAKVFAEKIAAIQAKKCLIILDCCHAENMAVEKGLSLSAGFLKGFVEEVDSVLDQAPALAEKSIVPAMKKGSGRVILTSCQANETSLDVGTNGLFTQVLLECLEGQNNIENDGWVRLIDLIRYIPSTVAERAEKLRHQQHPMFKRIENLSHEDFVVCAYDMTRAKSNNADLVFSNGRKTDRLSREKEAIIQLIDQGDLVQVFQQLDQFAMADTFQYNRFKKEFSAGIKGIDLIDFADRLKVFLRQQ